MESPWLLYDLPTPASFSVNDYAGRRLSRIRLIPAPLVEMIDGRPILKPGAQTLFVELAASDTAPATYQEDGPLDTNGQLYTWTLSFTQPRYTVETRQFLRRFARVKWIALVESVGGSSWLVGTKDFPLMLRSSSAVGGNKNNSTLTLTGQGPRPAVSIATIEDTALAGPGAFDPNDFFDTYDV
ncbi:MAG: hypothetical protein J7576_18645 [Siphonobacter aquaeclarae]|nr:hypothetical protein [Siphonobacter aquaeclarae]